MASVLPRSGTAALLSFAALLGALSLLHSCAAVQYDVGDLTGWTLNYNYTQWAASHVYSVDDTLFFRYDKGAHSVLELNKADYQNCTLSTPLKAEEGGNTTVTLDKAGRYWFVCGFGNHCQQGMKFTIDVGESSSATASSPAPAPASSYAAPLQTGAFMGLGAVIAAFIFVLI